MKYIFGPVSSRRFGASLGVDLSPGAKCCNFDCLYCELGKGRVKDAIENPPTVAEVARELKTALEEFPNIDVITLTAKGEPTLYPNLKELVARVNELKTTQKTLILSNGTVALYPERLAALKGLDIVKFSLDSAVAKTFRRIDRGLENYDLSKIIEGMAKFRAEFRGELVMETLVLAGFNDTEAEFSALNEAFARIKPDRIDISTLDRPPAYDVGGVSEERLRELARLITAAPVFVATRHPLAQKMDYSLEELEKLLALRPQSKFDVENNFSEAAKSNLNALLERGITRRETLAGMEFYRV